MPIYVIGHKSPDLDSVVAAIAYADFKNKPESTDKYIPAIAGEPNKETKYALEKFGIAQPEILNNVAGKEIAMVDHNEFGQAADGISEAKIYGVLDHHKLDFKYNEPITITTKPWGATCSIIAHWYFKNEIIIEKSLAGLMLSAILVDTVITKSPTCTEDDKQIIIKLSEIAGITDWQSYGMEIFKVRSSVGELSNEQIIKNDFKDFNFKSGKFGIGQIETVNLSEFANREDELLVELNKLKESGSYHTVILFITDIVKEGSQFLIASSDFNKVKEALNAKIDSNRVYIPGILSRKKQVIPKFIEIFDK